MNTQENTSTRPTEDLREFYITPLYLEVMGKRARLWSEEFIKTQMKLFQESIPGYPEVNEILEGELYARELNAFKKEVRRSDTKELNALLKRHSERGDLAEMITVELELRSGVKKLTDTSGES